MIKIAITGGIGSGKSYVCQRLEDMGIPVYNADNEAKHLMTTDAGIKSSLVSLLGKDAYKQDGSLNKTLLTAYLFASSKHVALINGIVHPVVRTDFNRWAEEQEKSGKAIVGLESAILYEAKFENTVDAVVMVYAPEELRLKRVMERDGVTQTQVQTRMSQQLSDEEKCQKADFIIWNDEIKTLYPQLEKLVTELRSRIKKER